MGSLPAAFSLGTTGSVLGCQAGVLHPGHHQSGSERQRGGDDQVRRDVPEPGDEPRGEERRQRGAAHADAEHTGRESTPGLLVPGIDERDAEGERGAPDAEEEPEQQQQRIGIDGAGEGDQQHRHDGDQRDHGEHLPAAVAIGERADRDPAHRADQDRRGDQQSGLRAGQRHRLGVRRGQRADEIPGQKLMAKTQVARARFAPCPRSVATSATGDEPGVGRVTTSPIVRVAGGGATGRSRWDPPCDSSAATGSAYGGSERLSADRPEVPGMAAATNVNHRGLGCLTTDRRPVINPGHSETPLGITPGRPAEW